jgi:hypothetical protein
VLGLHAELHRHLRDPTATSGSTVGGALDGRWDGIVDDELAVGGSLRVTRRRRPESVSATR